MDAGKRPGGPAPAAPDPRGNRVSVEIYGEQYTVRGDADEAYMHDLARRLDQRMRELAARRPQLSTNQLAVLTALNTLDELVRLESQYHRVLALFEREWERRRHEVGAPPQVAAAGEPGGARGGSAGVASVWPPVRDAGPRDGAGVRSWGTDGGAVRGSQPAR